MFQGSPSSHPPIFPSCLLATPDDPSPPIIGTRSPRRPHIATRYFRIADPSTLGLASDHDGVRGRVGEPVGTAHDKMIRSGSGPWRCADEIAMRVDDDPRVGIFEAPAKRRPRDAVRRRGARGEPERLRRSHGHSRTLRMAGSNSRSRRCATRRQCRFA